MSATIIERTYALTEEGQKWARIFGGALIEAEQKEAEEILGENELAYVGGDIWYKEPSGKPSKLLSIRDISYLKEAIDKEQRPLFGIEFVEEGRKFIASKNLQDGSSRVWVPKDQTQTRDIENLVVSIHQLSLIPTGESGEDGNIFSMREQLAKLTYTFQLRPNQEVML